MKCITCHTVTDDFRKDLGSPPVGKLEFFQDQDAGALTDHKSIAFQIKRAGRVFRIIIPGRQSPQRSETGNAHWRDCRFSATANHRFSVTTLDDLEAVADG